MFVTEIIFSPTMRLNSLLTALTAGFLLLCCPTTAQNESPRTVLTWEDFTPSTIQEIGMASSIDVAVSQALVRAKGRTFQDLYIVEVSTESSLYDPSKVTDWDLRYNQLLYDMALLSMKQALKDNHSGQVGIYEVYGRYRQIYDATKVDFMIRSVSGRDTAVISIYEDSLKAQVAAIKDEDFFSIPFYLSGSGAVPAPFSTSDTGYTGYTSTALALLLGYENDSYLTGLSGYFGSFNGLNISAEIRVNSQFRFEAQYALLWGKLKSSGFHHDYKNNYTWRGKTTRAGILRLGAGYHVLSADKIRLTPFGGLQLTTFTQDTDKTDKKGNTITSSVSNGGGAYFGMDIDYFPLGTWALRFKIFGSYESFKRTEATWSLNSGFTITL